MPGHTPPPKKKGASLPRFKKAAIKALTLWLEAFGWSTVQLAKALPGEALVLRPKELRLRSHEPAAAAGSLSSACLPRTTCAATPTLSGEVSGEATRRLKWVFVFEQEAHRGAIPAPWTAST